MIPLYLTITNIRIYRIQRYMFQSYRGKQFLTVLKSPSAVIFLIAIAILLLQIMFIGKVRPFNSDDLYWQLVVRHWTPFNGDIFYFGTKDIFLHQAPFFAVMEHLFEPSRKLLVAEVAILTIGAFSLAYASTLYFLQKLKLTPTYLTLLPFVWLASFGFPMVENYLNADWRTFQIGLSLATFALVAAYLFGDIHPFRNIWTKILTVLTLAYIGITIYSDPYYIFFTIAPLALFILILFMLKKIDRRQLFTVLGGVAISMIFAKICSILFEMAGATIVFDTPSAFVGFDDILKNTVSSVHGLLILYGADFFGRPAFNTGTAGAMLNSALLGFILYKAFGLRHAVKRPGVFRQTIPQLWVVFFAGLMAIIFLVYTSSSLVAVENYRFYILFAYCSITLLVIILSAARNAQMKVIVGALLIAATLFNVATVSLTDSVRTRKGVAGNIGNALNYDLIKTIKKEGIQKGYASYWQANVNTYFANNEVTFLPSLCTTEGKTIEFRWLIEEGLFERKTDKSFYLIDPDIPAPPICTQEQLVKQFGAPSKVVKVSNKSILVYDYDIATKIR